jgi:hypothetical protein
MADRLVRNLSLRGLVARKNSIIKEFCAFGARPDQKRRGKFLLGGRGGGKAGA